MILEMFDRTMKFLRLQNWFFILGKHYFFSIDSFMERHRKENLPQEEFPFQLTCETDPGIIPRLLECMKGSSDYNYLSAEEIVAKFEKFLKHKSTVWTAQENGQIIGFFWMTIRNYFVPCLRKKIILELKDDTAFIEFIFIKTSHRRKSVYSGMFKQVARLHPTIRFSCIVNSFNLPSIKAQLRLEFKPSGSLLYFTFFRCFFASIRFETTRKRLFRPKENISYRIKVQ
jgi:hypothetical protein